MSLHEELVDLFGVWVHVHEEDHDGLMVFLRDPSPLGMSRGRMVIGLGAGGLLHVTTPGPDDRLQPLVGEWKLDLDRQILILQYDSPANHETFKIESFERGRLVLRRLHETNPV